MLNEVRICRRHDAVPIAALARAADHDVPRDDALAVIEVRPELERTTAKKAFAHERPISHRITYISKHWANQEWKTRAEYNGKLGTAN
jgi:hypothetical protein